MDGPLVKQVVAQRLRRDQRDHRRRQPALRPRVRVDLRGDAAGLAAALHARHAGLSFVVLDREPEPGGTVRHYPRKKLVMTEPVKIPGFGRVGAREMRTEELVFLWDRIAKEAELPFLGDRAVKRVMREGELFTVESDGVSCHARRVILAIGRRGVPRRAPHLADADMGAAGSEGRGAGVAVSLHTGAAGRTAAAAC